MNLKTNWANGDYFTYLDYNRIANNIKEAFQVNGMTVPTIASKTVNDITYLEDLNWFIAWSNEVAHEKWGEIRPIEYKNPRVLTRDCEFWDYNDLNNLEKSIGLLDTQDSAVLGSAILGVMVLGRS